MFNSCLTLCDTRHCRPTRLLCPWRFSRQSTEVGNHSLSGNLPDPRVQATGSPALQQIPYCQRPPKKSIPIFLPENSRGSRSLPGYSPKCGNLTGRINFKNPYSVMVLLIIPVHEVSDFQTAGASGLEQVIKHFLLNNEYLNCQGTLTFYHLQIELCVRIPFLKLEPHCQVTLLLSVG